MTRFKPVAKNALAIFLFADGALTLTEAGTKRRASLHVVADEAGLAAHDRGGLDVMTGTVEAFAAELTRENHTLKRALTDPRLFSGIGNAYSDEILHAAKLSPIALTQKLTAAEIGRLHISTREVLAAWTKRLRDEARGKFPPKVTAFTTKWRCTGNLASRVRCAARPCSESATPRTRSTIAPAARPAGGCSRTAPCRDC